MVSDRTKTFIFAAILIAALLYFGDPNFQTATQSSFDFEQYWGGLGKTGQNITIYAAAALGVVVLLSSFFPRQK